VTQATGARAADRALGAPALFAYVDGRIVPMAEAHVSIATHALQYGTGVFEGLRAYWSEEASELYVVQALAHFQRLLESCRLLRLEVGSTPAELVRATLEVLRRSGLRQDAYIRPFAFKRDAVIKVKLAGLQTSLAIYAVPMGDYVATDGLRAQVSSWRRLSDNAIPARAKITGSYVNAALAVDDAFAAGFDEAILLNEDGHVAEASSANLFMVRHGALVTPPVTDGILEGITRGIVMTLAQERGHAVQERSIDRSELYSADEVFLCGTGAQIAPVVEIDRRSVGSGRVGAITSAIQAAYMRVCHGQDAEHLDWVTPVYAEADD
jgi:branched-chain amino acid aminotransferase